MRARLIAVLALAGALLLPASLFFHWYEIEAEGSVSQTGWQAFEAVDFLLVIAALAALAGLLSERWRAGLPLAGALAAIAVGLQLIEPPPLLSAYEEGGEVHVSRAIGAWLALGGSVLLFLAGLARLRSRSG